MVLHNNYSYVEINQYQFEYIKNEFYTYQR